MDDFERQRVKHHPHIMRMIGNALKRYQEENIKLEKAHQKIILAFSEKDREKFKKEYDKLLKERNEKEKNAKVLLRRLVKERFTN